MSKHNDNYRDNHWLVRPRTIKILWGIFIAVLAISVLIQWLFPVKGSFGVDGWFGFAALFGFAACALMVLVAKILGFVLKRDESYYRSDDDV